MKKLTDKTMKKLKVDKSSIRKVNTVDELIQEPPLMVLAKVVRDSNIGPSGDRSMRLKKGTVLAMPLGTYMTAERVNNSNRNKILKPEKKPFSQYFKRYRGQDLTGKKLFIWRGGGFGDLLFLQPLIKYIKKTYPSCQITMASFSRFLGILSDFPEGLIDNVLPVPFSVNHMFNNDYHLAFEGIIERCKEAEHVHAFDLMTKVANLNIDCSLPEYKTELIPNTTILKEVRDSLPSNYIVIQMRASSPIRIMGELKWSRIMKRIIEIGKKIVVMDRPEFSNYYSDLAKKFDIDSSKFFNFSSLSKTINHAVAIISKSDGVVGVDSAFTHIGAALNKPVLGLYGAFLGELRLKYYNNADWVQSKPTCKRAPCFWHHEQKYICEYLREGKAPECMECIDEDEVIEKFKKLMIKSDSEVS